MEMDFMKMIEPGLLILLPVLFGLNLFLRKIPKIPNWVIPIVSLALSITLSILHTIFASEIAFAPKLLTSGLIQGIIIAIAVNSTELYVSRELEKWNAERKLPTPPTDDSKKSESENATQTLPNTNALKNAANPQQDNNNTNKNSEDKK